MNIAATKQGREVTEARITDFVAVHIVLPMFLGYSLFSANLSRFG